MLRTNAHPVSMLAFAVADVLLHLPSLVRQTWWTPTLIRELRAAETDAARMIAYGRSVLAWSTEPLPFMTVEQHRAFVDACIRDDL